MCFQGGIRVNAFVTGGLVPADKRGTKQDGLMAAWDWYSTYAHLAGVDPTDHKAAAAGLPPIDSYNLWPLLSGLSQVSPRTELPIGSEGQLGGLIRGEYKLLLGTNSQVLKSRHNGCVSCIRLCTGRLDGAEVP